jgi:hypothetical protein
MVMLVANLITGAEMRFALETGRTALFAKLQAAGVGQISRVARRRLAGGRLRERLARERRFGGAAGLRRASTARAAARLRTACRLSPRPRADLVLGPASPKSKRQRRRARGRDHRRTDRAHESMTPASELESLWARWQDAWRWMQGIADASRLRGHTACDSPNPCEG